MLEKYDVAEQFTDVALEESVLATLAAQPDVYWRLVIYWLLRCSPRNGRRFMSPLSGRLKMGGT